MTTFSEAEAYRQRAIIALRAAGLTAEADRLAALLPIKDEATAYAAICPCVDAGSTAWDAGAQVAWGAALEAAGASAYAEES